jgi:hypothetical protein
LTPNITRAAVYKTIYACGFRSPTAQQGNRSQTRCDSIEGEEIAIIEAVDSSAKFQELPGSL